MNNKKTKLAFAKYLFNHGYITKTTAKNLPTRTSCEKGIAKFGLMVFEALYKMDLAKLQEIIDEVKKMK